MNLNSTQLVPSLVQCELCEHQVIMSDNMCSSHGSCIESRVSMSNFGCYVEVLVGGYFVAVPIIATLRFSSRQPNKTKI